MDFFTLLSNIISSGVGAFAGGLAAYYWACHRDEKLKIAEYLNLLLIIHEELSALYSLLSNIPPDKIEEIDGEKIVAFDLPFPKLNISSQQIQTLMEVAYDKDMPAALIQLQKFLSARTYRLSHDGVNILPVSEIEQYVWQLKGMLLSIRVQYEQETKNVFPLDAPEQNVSSLQKQ